ncbi:MAG: DMT family transporter [Dehalococcoidia bacterium]|jgi:hypothetical protein|nr:DMT family transporter [Dehalococcoidia bacterium]
MQLFYIGMAVAIGAGAGAQIAMLGAVGRQKGSLEATWITVLGTIAAAALILAVRALRGDDTLLPSPFDRASRFFAVAALTTVALAFSVRDIDPYYAVMGLGVLGVVLGAGFLGPRIGVALFIGAMIAGQLTTGLVLDHIGAFGAQVERATLLRTGGGAALIVGVALVRGGGE